ITNILVDDLSLTMLSDVELVTYKHIRTSYQKLYTLEQSCSSLLRRSGKTTVKLGAHRSLSTQRSSKEGSQQPNRGKVGVHNTTRDTLRHGGQDVFTTRVNVGYEIAQLPHLKKRKKPGHIRIRLGKSSVQLKGNRRQRSLDPMMERKK
ncbi:hypothetical protein GN958_ATG03305, partial [Phytophthora infestans]